jgi:hypothetical protein
MDAEESDFIENDLNPRSSSNRLGQLGVGRMKLPRESTHRRLEADSLRRQLVLAGH